MNIAITSKSFNKNSRHLEKLKGFHITSKVDSRTVGIIAGTEPNTKDVLQKAPKLKVISRNGVGLDNIDLDYCKQHNIKIFTTTSQTLAVAEFTVTMMLNLLKKIHQLPNKQYGSLLTKKSIGIIGWGSIGKEVTRLLQPYHCLLHVHDIAYETSMDIQEVFEYSDIVTIHLPLTKHTNHLIDKRYFNMASKQLLLINTARSEIVNEKDLYVALKNKDIAGAAIDVCKDKIYDALLSSLDNTIVTPHMASFCVETRESMEQEAVDNLLEGLK